MDIDRRQLQSNFGKHSEREREIECTRNKVQTTSVEDENLLLTCQETRLKCHTQYTPDSCTLEPSHTYTHIHTQTHTLLFRVQNPASRGNNEMSALKRLSGDNRQASTSPPSLRCRIRRLRSKGAAGPRLPNCRSQGCHSNGDWRAIHSSAVSRAGRRGAVNSMGVLKVRNGSF